MSLSDWESSFRWPKSLTMMVPMRSSSSSAFPLRRLKTLRSALSRMEEALPSPFATISWMSDAATVRLRSRDLSRTMFA